jgi:hypothetical protein
MVCTCSLRLEEASPSGSVFRTFVTIEARGKVAEAVRVCRAGDVVLVQGKLFWRKVSIPEGGQDVSSLALLVQRCSVLIPNTQEVSYD